jgi:hypothetical protein
VDTIVKETSTADPNKPVENSTFEPKELFAKPLAWTWSDTKGADLSWVPIGFQGAFRMAYSRTRYGTGYYIYHQYAPGAPLSRPIEAWKPRASLDPDVLALIDKPGGNPAAFRPAIHKRSSPGGGTLEFSQPGVVRALSFTVHRQDAEAFARGRLRITWDGRELPSVDAPIGCSSARAPSTTATRAIPRQSVSLSAFALRRAVVLQLLLPHAVLPRRRSKWSATLALAKCTPRR